MWERMKFKIGQIYKNEFNNYGIVVGVFGPFVTLYYGRTETNHIEEDSTYLDSLIRCSLDDSPTWCVDFLKSHTTSPDSIPEEGSLFRHKERGTEYMVIYVTNIDADLDRKGEFPPTVSYMNTKTKEKWTLPVTDFLFRCEPILKHN